jgi:3D (Asp-Asp-Asp) domain-containing protein
MAKVGDTYLEVHADLGPVKRQVISFTQGAQSGFGRFESTATRAFRQVGSGAQGAKAGTNQFQGSLRQTGVEAASTGRKADRTGHQISLVGTAAKRTGGLLGSSTGRLLAFGAGFASVSAGIGAARNAVGATEDLAKGTLALHRNLGLTIQDASRWAAVAKARGIDTSDLSTSFTNLSKNVEKALSPKPVQASIKAFADLGISTDQLKTGQKDFSGLIRVVADGLGGMEGGAKRAATANQLLGRSSQNTLPIFTQGNKALQEQLRLADKYGVTLDGKTIKSVNQLRQVSKELEFAQMGLQIQFTRTFGPVLVKAFAGANKFINDTRRIFNRKDLTGEEKWNKFGDMVSRKVEDALPKIANAAGRIAPRVALGFVRGFIRADVWGQLAAGAFILSKLSSWGPSFKKKGGRDGAAYGNAWIARASIILAGWEAFRALQEPVTGPGLSAGNRELVAAEISKQGGTNIRFGGKRTIHYTDANGNKRTYTIPRQRGGMIPGVGDGDKVHVLAEPGEGFINKRAVQGLGGPRAVDEINKRWPRFQQGGVVGFAKTSERLIRERLGPERFKELNVSRLIERVGGEKVERFMERLGPEKFSRLVEREGPERVTERVSRERVERVSDRERDRKTESTRHDISRLVERSALTSSLLAFGQKSVQAIADRSRVGAAHVRLEERLDRPGDAIDGRARDRHSQPALVHADPHLAAVRQVELQRRVAHSDRPHLHRLLLRSSDVLSREVTDKASRTERSSTHRERAASSLREIGGRLTDRLVERVLSAPLRGVHPHRQDGMFRALPSLGRDAESRRAHDDRLIFRAPGLRRLGRVASGEAASPLGRSVQRLEAMLDVPLRATARDSKPKAPDAKVVSLHVGQPSVSISGPVGIAQEPGQGFALGGLVRPVAHRTERHVSALRERLGRERFERLKVADLIERTSAAQVERFVERLGPERFARTVERQGPERVTRQIQRERVLSTKLDKGSQGHPRSGGLGARAIARLTSGPAEKRRFQQKPVPAFAKGGLVAGGQTTEQREKALKALGKKHVQGRVSTFGPPTETAGKTASGRSSSEPGIALYEHKTLGKRFRVTVKGHSAVLPHIDVGPAPSTKRTIDITGAGARALGFDPRRFPTDTTGAAQMLASGGIVKPRVTFQRGGIVGMEWPQEWGEFDPMLGPGNRQVPGYKTGGAVAAKKPQATASKRGDFQDIVRRAWRHLRTGLGVRGAPTPVVYPVDQIGQKIPGGGRTDAFTVRGRHGAILFRRDVAGSLLKGNDFPLYELVHEFAHTQQDPGVIASHRLAEGGATGFGLRKTPGVARALGMQYDPASVAPQLTPFYAQSYVWVDQHRGSRWIDRDQFMAFNKAGKKVQARGARAEASGSGASGAKAASKKKKPTDLGAFVSTSYGPPWVGIQGTGTTATGINLKNAPHAYIVAVDPTVVPLHSRLAIHPNPFSYGGAFGAEDTGGAIKGNRIDFYDWRGRASQQRWGKRAVQVQSAGKGGAVPKAKGPPAKDVIQTIEGRANYLDSLQLPYIWGGHHGDRGPIKDPRPGLDCSSAVSYVLGIPPRDSTGLMSYGKKGPGPVEWFANPTHTFMNIKGQGFGTSPKNPHRGPGWLPYATPQEAGSFPGGKYVTRHLGLSSTDTTTIKGVTVKGPVTFKTLLDALGTKLESNLALAKLNNNANRPGTFKDDLRAEKKLLAYWKGKLKLARKGKDYPGITEAANSITDYKDQIAETNKSIRKKKTAAEAERFKLGDLSVLKEGSEPWNIGGLQPTLDTLQLRIAKAGLTATYDSDGNQIPATLGDDITAADDYRKIWEDVYKLASGFDFPSKKGHYQKQKDGSFKWIATGKPIHVLGTIKQQTEAATTLQTARDALRSLETERNSYKAPGQTESERALADLLKEQLAASQKELAIVKAQFPIFQQFASAPRFHSGGIVPGSPSQEVPIIAKGGEAIGQMGEPQPVSVTVVVEDGAGVDPNKIRVVVNDEVSEMVRKARSGGPAPGRRYVLPR